ncbi:MAG: hypothetical protein KDD38_08580 [Bdellovibrionales bacterium]|nr:hypothetical protein [Bdellovibrionales bacterium]
MSDPGRFQLWTSINLAVTAFVLVSVIDKNLLGLRWLLPDIFLYKEASISLCLKLMRCSELDVRHAKWELGVQWSSARDSPSRFCQSIA